ncbi:MAG: hypothetical protein IKZ82_08260 [Clostridia bacterium]|nr:hypothetical protein [Clostridia bacterium]
MLYGKSIIATGYRETDGLPRCPVCGETVTAEAETVMADGGSGELSPVNIVQCEHCHAQIHYASYEVAPEMEPYCDTGTSGNA